MRELTPDPEVPRARSHTRIAEELKPRTGRQTQAMLQGTTNVELVSRRQAIEADPRVEDFEKMRYRTQRRAMDAIREVLKPLDSLDLVHPGAQEVLAVAILHGLIDAGVL